MTFETDLWTHLRRQHGTALAKVLRQFKLYEKAMDDAQLGLTLYNAALLQQERQSVLLLGHSTDRRTLHHVAEVFREDRAATLMCFVCSCKELSITGYNMFGEQVQKGNMSYRTNKAQVLHIIARGCQ